MYVVMAIDVEPKRTVRKLVGEKIASGECLHCTEHAERLGLCGSHYHQYRMTLLQKPANEREVWKAQQIRDGKVLKSRQGQRLGLDNPFDDED